MRTIFLLPVYLFLVDLAHAQPFTEVGKTYEFAGNVLLQQCDVAGSTANLPSSVLSEYWLFSIVKELANGDKVVYVKKFTNNDNLNKAYFNATAGSDQPKVYFLIKSTDFAAIKRVPERQWEFGTVLMPLKLRFGKREGNNQIRYFDFTSEVNIGLSLARRLSPRRAHIKSYLIGSIGTTAIPVDSFTTQGKVATKTTLAAFSPTLGLLFYFKDTNFQLVISTGYDIIPGEVGRNWLYRKSPFLGIGAGFSIFSFGNRNSNTAPNTTP